MRCGSLSWFEVFHVNDVAIRDSQIGEFSVCLHETAKRLVELG